MYEILSAVPLPPNQNPGAATAILYYNAMLYCTILKHMTNVSLIYDFIYCTRTSIQTYLYILDVSLESVQYVYCSVVQVQYC